MLDRWSLKIIKAPLRICAKGLIRLGISADQITISGFALGMLVLPALALQHYLLALAFIILNRVFDGLDGAVARLTTVTNRGAFLDIVLDFIFYSAVVFGFALASPEANALPAAALIFSFIGTGSSFLAFAIIAERLNLESMAYPNKGFYYLNGITEGSETIAFFIAMCLLPQYFAAIAWAFFCLCIITTVTRVIGGAYSLRSDSKSPDPQKPQ